MAALPPAWWTVRRRGLAMLACLLALGLAGVRFARALPDVAVRPSHAFGFYYALGRMLAEGEDLAASYDPEHMARVMARSTPGVSDINLNPPPVAVLFWPLGGLDYVPARIVWTALNLALLAGAGVLLLREAGLAGPWAVGFAALALAFAPLSANFHVGNMYVLLLALLAGSWVGFRRGRDGLLGVCLGLAVVLKLAGILLLPLLLVERRTRALAWTAGTAAAVAALTLPVVGLAAWRADAALLLAHGARPERAVTAYQSVHSFVHHLLARHEVWNPAPLADLPALATVLALGAAGVLVAAGLVAAARRPGDDGVFAAFVVASVVVSPLALDYTYTLLLLPAAVAVARVRAARRPLAWVVLGAALVAVGADLPYRSPRLAAGWWALLAYPKLAGALALWGLFLVLPRGARATARGDAVEPAA